MTTCSKPASLTRRTFGAISATAAVAALSACGGKPTGRAGRAVDEVTYLTGFGLSGRESHAVVAKEKGFFADARVKVTIQPGAAGDSNHRLLNAGKAQFAGVDSSGAFTRYGRGLAGLPGGDTSFQVVVLDRHGNDRTWATHAHTAMRDEGLTDVTTVVSAQSWPGNSAGSRLVAAGLAQLRPELLDVGMTPQRLDRVQELLADPAVELHGHRLYSTSGRRPTTPAT